MEIGIAEVNFRVEEPTGGNFEWVYATCIISCPLSTAHGFNCGGRLRFANLRVGRMHLGILSPRLDGEQLFGDPYGLNPAKSRELACPECGIKVQMTDKQTEKLWEKVQVWGEQIPRPSYKPQG